MAALPCPAALRQAPGPALFPDGWRRTWHIRRAGTRMAAVIGFPFRRFSLGALCALAAVAVPLEDVLTAGPPAARRSRSQPEAKVLGPYVEGQIARDHGGAVCAALRDDIQRGVRVSTPPRDDAGSERVGGCTRYRLAFHGALITQAPPGSHGDNLRQHHHFTCYHLDTCFPGGTLRQQSTSLAGNANYEI